MSLKKFGSYNDFPKDFPMPEKLKKGETATYRLVNSEPDPKFPTDPKKRKYATTKIPPKDRIERSGVVVDIGMIKAVDSNDQPVDFEYRYISDPFGYLTLTGGNIKDEALYTYLELSNYNEANPYRDASINPVLRRIDEVGMAKDTRKKRSARLEAMNRAQDMGLREVKEFALARGWNQDEDENLLRQRMEELAENDPLTFMKFAEDKVGELIRANIKRAVDQNKISFDITQHRWVYVKGNELITVVGKAEGVKPLDQLADWFKTGGKQADNAYARLQKEIKPALEEAVA